VLTEHARDATLVVPLNFHPREWLKLSVAPGVEFAEKGNEVFVLRLGAAYEWEFGDYNVAPEFRSISLMSRRRPFTASASVDVSERAERRPGASAWRLSISRWCDCAVAPRLTMIVTWTVTPARLSPRASSAGPPTAASTATGSAWC
jgi:hypothetical protein